ncbi:hypothetical protein [Pannonibacter indicus]|uniref:hypothetical protein n=1 Tax=Pannonibacter indicus TaxID=466044 RepID=UPI0035B051EB
MANILGLQHMTLHGVDAMIKSWHDENGCVRCPLSSSRKRGPVHAPPDRSGGDFGFEKNHLGGKGAGLIQLLRTLIQTN